MRICILYVKSKFLHYKCFFTAPKLKYYRRNKVSHGRREKRRWYFAIVY